MLMLMLTDADLMMIKHDGYVVIGDDSNFYTYLQAPHFYPPLFVVFWVSCLVGHAT